MKNSYSVKNSLILWGGIGITLRAVFMPISLHSDLLYIYSIPSFLTFHNVWDIYGYFKDTLINQAAGFGHTYYPPITYYLMALFQTIFKIIDIGYADWISRCFDLVLSEGPITRYISLLSAKNVPVFLTLMKMPYFLFDMGCGFILYKYFKDKSEALRAFKLWMINPVVIFSSYIFGQYGVISAFIVLLAVYLIKKGHFDVAFFLIGCGVMTEMYPIMFLPAFLLIPDAPIRKRLRWLFMSMIPMIVVFVPLYITSGGYVKYAFVSKIMQKAMFSIGITRRLVVVNVAAKALCMAGFALLYIRLLAGAFNGKGAKAPVISPIYASYVVIFMLLFLATGYSAVHYLQWVMPFLIILVIKKVIPLYLFMAQIALLFVFNLDSRQLNMMLFMPINPEYFAQLPSLHEIMNRYFYWGHVIGAARLLYSGVCIFTIYKVLKALKNESTYTDIKF